MKFLAYSLSGLSMCLILLVLPLDTFAQDFNLQDTADIKYFEAATEIMTAASTCALITLDAEGRPRVRVMDPFPPEGDLTVWLATNPKSRKVTQIMNDPRVTLYYLRKDDSGYVMIHGNARLVENHYEKEKYWKGSWEAFYPNYPYDYLLIEVKPEWMEVVSYPHGIVGDSITWQPPVIGLDSKN